MLDAPSVQLLLGAGLVVSLAVALAPALCLPERLIRFAAWLSPHRRQTRALEWLGQLDELSEPWSRLALGLGCVRAGATTRVACEGERLQQAGARGLQTLRTLLLLLLGLLLVRLFISQLLKQSTVTPYAEQDGQLVPGPAMTGAAWLRAVSPEERLARRRRRVGLRSGGHRG